MPVGADVVSLCLPQLYKFFRNRHRNNNSCENSDDDKDDTDDGHQARISLREDPAADGDDSVMTLYKVMANNPNSRGLFGACTRHQWKEFSKALQMSMQPSNSNDQEAVEEEVPRRLHKGKVSQDTLFRGALKNSESLTFLGFCANFL